MNSILAIETATSACSAALIHEGKMVERFEVGSNIHSKKLLSMVDSLFKEASISIKQLNAIAVGQGPGSFTGLRIGVGVGQGLAFSANLPMVAICPLQALAEQFNERKVLAGFDARMSEIYWAAFIKDADSARQSLSVNVTAPADIVLQSDDWLAVGTAWQEYMDVLPVKLKQQLNFREQVDYPRASFMLNMAEQKLQDNDMVKPLDFSPVYIRNKVAKKKGE